MARSGRAQGEIAVWTKIYGLLRKMTRGFARHPYLLLVFLFYYFTAARTIGMADTAILVADIQDFKISTAVNSHNLVVLFGKPFAWLPVGSLAFRGSLLSVCFGGWTVALFYLLVYRSFQSRFVASACAAIFAVSHSMWWHSTAIESYAINAFLMTAALYLLVRYREDRRERWLLGLIGVAGVGVFHHLQLAVIGLAALIVATAHIVRVLRDRQHRRHPAGVIARIAGVGLAALVPYGLALALDLQRSGDWAQIVSGAAGGHFKPLMFTWAGGLGLVDTILLTILQFPSPFLLMVVTGAVAFAWSWKASASGIAVFTMFLVNTVFFALYHTWDRYAFLLISFVILAFWGAFGLDQLLARRRVSPSHLIGIVLLLVLALCVVAPPWIYAHMTSWQARPGSVWAMRFNHPTPSNTIDYAVYNANPNRRGYTDIEVFTDLLFERLPANAIYLTDDAWFHTVEYYRLYEGRRPDLAVNFLNSWGFAGWGLSRQELAGLLQYARDADLPLYLGSLAAPFDRQLAAIGRPYAFEPFLFDRSRWIYRLATARELGAGESETPAPFFPQPRRTIVGYGLGAPGAIVTDRIRADRDFGVQFEFDRNPIVFPLTFRWIAPDGAARFSSPLFVVPSGSGSFGWVQEHRGIVRPGRWRVEVWVGQQRVDQAEFTVL